MSNAEIIASAVDGLDSFEKEEFRSLWQRYVENIEDGIEGPQLILPEKVGQRLGEAKLQEIALNYSSNIGVHVRVVHDSELKAYLIGDAKELPFGVTGQERIFDTDEEATAEDPISFSDFESDQDEDMDEDIEDLTSSPSQALLNAVSNAVPNAVPSAFSNLDEDRSTGILPIPRDTSLFIPNKSTTSVSKRQEVTPMEGTSKSSKSKEAKLPKPSNSFILYRKFKQPMVLASNPDLHCSKVSKIIGDMWRAEDPTVKKEFQRQADEQKRLFMEKNPDWKCSPRKSSDIRRRNKTASRTSAVSSSTGFPLNEGTQLAMSGNSSYPGEGIIQSVDTMDVSQTSSEPLPTLETGDLPWSMGIDYDEPDLIDRGWLRTLPTIDADTPDEWLQRRNMFLTRAAEHHRNGATRPSV